MKLILTLFAFSALFCGQSFAAEKKPLKVFILAGQSNMEGPAKIETFDYIGDDPATAPLLKQMRGADGKPRVCDGAWIAYLTGANEKNFEITGKLTAGYGSMWGLDSTKPGNKIGPEFTFGLTMDAAHAEPVLIIKTAWGGKSLHTDFRPPSAGPYQLNDFQKKLYYGPKGHGVPKDMDQWLADKKRETGHYYRLMVDHVKKVLADPKRVVPDYDAAQGYEIAGFVWLQGWNDMVDGHVYPAHGKPGQFDVYSELLAHFIRDVRKDLGAPKMPFVIGVMGVGGAAAGKETVEFRKAMAAPSALPEFKGNVVAVETAPFWSEELGAIDKKREKVSQMRYYLDSKHKNYANADGKMTDAQKREYLKNYEAELIPPAEAARWKRGASNAGYHYLGCAKTFALMGRAFAEATLQMMALRHTSPANANKPGAPVARQTRNISGWQVHIQLKLLESEPADTERALILLKEMLDQIARDVPAPAVAELRKVPLYFSPAYKPGRSGAEFHPDAGWLRDNGRDPAMARGVEFSGVHDFEAETKRMPNFALHELAHAYHDRVLKDGFDNTEIKAAYERVRAAGSYARVERTFGNGRPNTSERAYAMTSPMEYFSETTEAFFSRNDFFPFTRDELRRHDPEMFALLAKLWGAAERKTNANNSKSTKL